MHPPLDPDRLARALAAFELPAPVAVTPLGTATWRLDLPGRSFVLRTAARESLEAERAAVRLAAAEGIPVVPSCEVLADDVLGFPASLAPLMPGVPGDALAESAVIGAGALLAEISAASQPSWGTRAADGRFLRTHERWRVEWQARVEQVGAAGSDAVLGRIRDDLGALDGCSAWSLVHGDLRPANVLYVRTHARLTPTAVLGWGGSCLGDPLADWAAPLSLPTATLARLVDGFGAEEVAAWLDDPEVLARLGVYWRTRCLERRADLEAAADPHAVRDRLRAALAPGD